MKMQNLPLKEADHGTTKSLLDAFEKHIKPKINVTYERYIFHTACQQEESVDEYIARLHKLVATFQYGTLSDDFMKDRLITGIKSIWIRTYELGYITLQLQKAIDVCKSAEQTESAQWDQNTTKSNP